MNDAPTSPIAFVRYYNAWRVGGDMDQPEPSTITRMLTELCDHAEQLERELAAERALADRLAETLRFIEEDCDWKAGGDHWHGSFGDDRIGPACEEALAAWKASRDQNQTKEQP